MNKSLQNKVPYCTKCLQLMRVVNRLSQDKYLCKCRICGKEIILEG